MYIFLDALSYLALVPKSEHVILGRVLLPGSLNIWLDVCGWF
jgi:hypothetical protein